MVGEENYNEAANSGVGLYMPNDRIILIHQEAPQ